MLGEIDFAFGFLMTAGIYAVLSLGLNVHWGHTGLFNIGIAAFFALGAYTAALLATPPPSSTQFEDFVFGGDLANYLGSDTVGIDLYFPLVLIAAAAVSAFVGLIVGTVTIRLRDDYLAIATLGLAESVRLLFLNEDWLANGSRGLYRIPKAFDGFVPDARYDTFFFFVVVAVLAILYLAAQRAGASPWGRVLRAIRENENTAQAAGKNVFWFKLQAFMFGAAIMGVGGALFTFSVRFLDPPTFDPLFATFIIWAMLMVGGSGNHRGAILGAFVVWGIWSYTQRLDAYYPDFLEPANVRFFMIGFLIILVLLFRPIGILPERNTRT